VIVLVLLSASILQLQAGCKTYLIPDPAPAIFQKNKAITVELAPIDAGPDWTEAIPAWNVDHPELAELTVEARVVYADRTSKYYSFGTWSGSNLIGSRFSVKGQKDADGTVLTDTLRMERPGGQIQFRLTGRVIPARGSGALPKLTRLFVNVWSPDQTQSLQPQAPSPEPQAHLAWGEAIDPPRLAQGDYPGGKGLCSPTSVAMVLDYWAARTGVKSLGASVPQVQSSVYDSVYAGTGNWALNTSYAGSKPGLLGYAARLSSIDDLERWIDKGVPIVCSVSWYLLHGEDLQSDEEGHLVVLVGFTSEGDPIFNDPGKRGEVRKVYKRADFLNAWAYSKHTVYVICPPKFVDDQDVVTVKRGSL